MVGGADLGLDLAEELGRLAPFGMGNPGVRLLVPAARVRDVRPMGQEGKHARFSLHSRRPPGARGRLRPLEARRRRRRHRRRRGAARGQPLERRGRAARRPPRALPARGGAGEPDEAARPRPSGGSASRPSSPPTRPRLAADAAIGRRQPRARGAGGPHGLRLGRRDPRRARLERRRGPRPGRRPAAAGADGEDRRHGSPSTRSSSATPTWPRELRARRPRRPAAFRAPRAARRALPGRRRRATCIPPGASPSAASRSPPSTTSSPGAGCSPASSATSATPARARATGCYEALRGSGAHPRGPEAAARCFGS